MLASAAPTELARLTRLMEQGDEDAYREFFDCYFHRLLAYLLVVTRGNEPLARDLVQQTMIKVARHIRPFDDDAVLWRWLTLLARTAAIDEGRKAQRFFTFIQRFWQRHPAPESKVGQVSIEELLSTEFENLDPDDRKILERKYFAECSIREIADELHITQKAVESKLSRARAKLKTRILAALKNEQS